MGRWAFPGGGQEPIYIPDEGEEGGGGFLNHLAMALGGAHERAVASKPMQLAGQVAGMPARAVTAAGHAMAPGGYTGTSDPLQYIATGEKTGNEADLAHYGDLLADTMEAEGTINEQGPVSWAIRKAGEAISDPLVLFGAARAAARAAGPSRAPGLRDRRIPPQPSSGSKAPPQTGPGGASPKPKRTSYRQPPIDPEEAAKYPSAPLDTDLASPGVFTTGGVKPLPRVQRPQPPPRAQGAPSGRPSYTGSALDTDIVSPGPATRSGGSFPNQMQGAARRGRQMRSAYSDMRAEQLGQGVEAMGQEFARPRPQALHELLMSAVENGADANAIMTLLSNLGG